MAYLRPVCLQPDPTDGSFDYFARGGSGHRAKHFSEPNSDGFEVRGTSRKLLHTHGESPSAPNAAIGTADNRSSTRSSPSQHRHQRPLGSSFPRQSCHWHIHWPTQQPPGFTSQRCRPSTGRSNRYETSLVERLWSKMRRLDFLVSGPRGLGFLDFLRAQL